MIISTDEKGRPRIDRASLHESFTREMLDNADPYYITVSGDRIEVRDGSSLHVYRILDHDADPVPAEFLFVEYR